MYSRWMSLKIKFWLVILWYWILLGKFSDEGNNQKFIQNKKTSKQMDTCKQLLYLIDSVIVRYRELWQRYILHSHHSLAIVQPIKFNIVHRISILKSKRRKAKPYMIRFRRMDVMDFKCQYQALNSHSFSQQNFARIKIWTWLNVTNKNNLNISIFNNNLIKN